MKIHELRESKANKVAEMRGLVDTATREKRVMGDNESGRFEALKGEVSGLEIRIGQAETLANLERHAEAAPVDGAGTGNLEALEARFSLGKAIREHNETGKLTGLEAEYNAERRSGRKDSFAVPVSILIGNREQRYVGTQQPASGPGGVLVPTDLGPLIDRPRPSLAVQNLGATTLSGLVGNLDLPRQKTSGVGYWIPEHGPTTGSDPSFDKVSMNPKTVSGRYEITRRMMIQAPTLEQILRNDLGWVIAQQLDLAATQGTGANDMPRGIQSTPGVKKVTQAYAGAKPTAAEMDRLILTMMSLVEDSDIGGSTGFLAHPRVRALLESFRDSTDQPVTAESFLRNQRAAWSTQITANAGAGTNLAKLFYGNWPDLIIGYWSSVDIVLNPYAKEMADRGGAYLYAFLDADVAVRHPESFTFTDSLPVVPAGGAGGPTVTTVS